MSVMIGHVLSILVLLSCIYSIVFVQKINVYHGQEWNANMSQMRGTGDKLEDKYIVPIARELAVALKAIHDQGIIHRDVKGKPFCQDRTLS